jgi:hypothetical protein
MVEAPPPDARDLREGVRIAVVLFGLLLVYLGDDVINRAVGGARRRRGLRSHARAQDKERDCPSHVHAVIIAPTALARVTGDEPSH